MTHIRTLLEKVRLGEVNIKKVDGKNGFDFKGQFITDPTMDPSGRFDVDPKKYYGLNDKQIKDLTEGFSSSLKQKAKELAKKFANNMTKATDEIEKLAKGLSDDPDVYKVIRQYNEEVDMEEGRIKDIFTANQEGESAAEISKRLGISLSTVKKILGEETVEKLEEFTTSQINDLQKSYADLKGKTISPEKATALSKHLDRIDLQSLKQLVKANIPFVSTVARNKVYKKTGKFEQVEEEKTPAINPDKRSDGEKNVKKEEEGSTEKEKSLKIKLDKEKDQDALEKQLVAAQGQINILKQKLENEKNKAIKPQPNKDTGEVPLSIGLANKLLKDKAEKEEVKESVNQVQAKSDGKGNYNLIYRGKEIGYYHKERGKYVVYHSKEDGEYSESDEVSTEMQAKKLAYDNMNESTNKALSDREKRLQRAKDMIKYYDMAKKRALKGPHKALAKKMLKSELEEATMVSDISGISIPALKRETAKFNIKVARVTPGGPMGAEYEVTFTGREQDLIRYAKEHLGFDDKPGTFQQLKKHLNMDYVPELKEATKPTEFKVKMKTSSGMKTVNVTVPVKNYKVDMAAIEDAARKKVKGDMIDFDFKGDMKEATDKDSAYAIGMAQAKKSTGDTPPLEKSTIKKGHEIAKAIMKDKKEATIKPYVSMQRDSKTGKMNYVVLDKDEKEAYRSSNATVAQHYLKKNYEKLREEIEISESLEAVKNKAKKTGMPYGVLKKVYDRGMAAWKSGHRPGATQVQWALARVNSFVTKGSGTWGGADKDLAKQVKGK